MREPISPRAQEVLERGVLCYVAAPSDVGPHLTPLVFVEWGGRVWITTSRRSFKAGAWRHRPDASGLVRAGGLAVTFEGDVWTHDVLDPTTWVSSIRASPALSGASVRFTTKNARFFAGYAVDARRVPFAWMPPGRLFAEIEPRRLALLEGGRPVEVWGRWDREAASLPGFRARKRAGDPLGGLPAEVRHRLAPGDAVLAVQGLRGPVVLPAAWSEIDGSVYATLPAQTLGLAAPAPRVPVALAIDRASWWRARDMVGVMVQGEGAVHVLGGLDSGARSAAAIVQHLGGEPEGGALIRITPRRLVWWNGWTSGTVRAA